MTEKAFYKLIYSIIGNRTPIPADCGRLCSKACCEGDKEGDGMYLFPGEEKMYDKLPAWALISETDFEYGDETAGLFSCDGYCERGLRPLSCRIFPLTPYVDENGDWDIRVDKRSRGLCPMAVLEISDFDTEFVSARRRAMNVMRKNRKTREFLTALSRMTDELDFLK